MGKTTLKNYPNIVQSFKVTGILLLVILITSPLNVFLPIFISKGASMLICYLLAFLISLLIVSSIRKNKTGISSFNFDLNHKVIIPFIIIATLALQYGIISPIGALIPMPESVKRVFMELGNQTGFYGFILLVVAAPILEELIFRGIILDGLLQKYSQKKSIFVSSLLFGLVHLNPWQLITGFLIGIFSGWVYYNTKSVLPSIIIHVTANINVFLLSQFSDFGTSMNDSLTEMYGGIINLVAVIICAVIILIVCVFYLKKKFVIIASTQAQDMIDN